MMDELAKRKFENSFIGWSRRQSHARGRLFTAKMPAIVHEVNN
jgi:hypothetical protein